MKHADLAARVLDVLTDDPQTASDVGRALGITHVKASMVLRALSKAGHIRWLPPASPSSSVRRWVRGQRKPFPARPLRMYRAHDLTPNDNTERVTRRNDCVRYLECLDTFDRAHPHDEEAYCPLVCHRYEARDRKAAFDHLAMSREASDVWPDMGGV